MKRSAKFRTSEQGTVIFAVLMVCTAMLISAATMAMVVVIALHVESNRGQHLKVYNAARGIAISDIRKLQQGQSPDIQPVNLGDILVISTCTNTNPLQFRVTASTSDATDTISFCYDKISKKIVSWLENSPSS